ncbi:ribonuclease H-like domain-containing protein, partial [Tanacetum coccineum]
VTLSRSSVEAEYRGVANVVAETAWIRNLLRELHAPLFTATLVYCDNISTDIDFSVKKWPRIVNRNVTPTIRGRTKAKAGLGERGQSVQGQGHMIGSWVMGPTKELKDA